MKPIKTSFTQEQVDRWFSEVDPVIRRLRVLGEDVEFARVGAKTGPFIDLVCNTLPGELQQMWNQLIDAKGRLLGIDLEQPAQLANRRRSVSRAKKGGA